MPGPKAESVELTEKQRHLLQQVIRREKSMQQSVQPETKLILRLILKIPSIPTLRASGFSLSTVLTSTNPNLWCVSLPVRVRLVMS